MTSASHRSRSQQRTAGIASKAAATAACIVAGAASAQTGAAPGAQPLPAASAAVIAVVQVPKPWYAPRALVVSKMRDTIGQYAQLPGLSFKAFSFARESGDYGGLYHWQDAASAKAWFNPAWFERVRQERGAAGQVRYFDAPISIDNTPGGTPLNTDSAAVATLVQIALPAGVTRQRLLAEFRAAVPQYQQVPGLLRKHFIVSDGGTFGGLYLWADEGSAKAWFTPAWHDRVRASYGAPARIEWFDTPILLPTQRPDSVASANAMAVARP